MPAGSQTLSARDLMGFSDPFVDGYEARSLSGSIEGDDAPLFAGMHQTRMLFDGFKLETSYLTALCHSHHQATLKRSLTIALVLEGAPLDLMLGAGRFTLGPGQAMMIAMPDADRLAGLYQRGQSSRCILVQTRPEDLADDELAEKVETLLKGTSITRLPAQYCPIGLATDLFATGAGGPTVRLIEESCALALLALGLTSRTDDKDYTGEGVSRTDRRKMLRVRERLVSMPEREHRLGDLAREAGVSVTTLKTKFTAVFGRPVFAYLRDVRLERARTGIEQEGWTVSQAAYAVGYRHLGSFSDAFRRKFGTLPSDVRRRLKASLHP